MFSTDRILRRGAIAIACLGGLGGTALAETLVVRAGGPSAASYPAGKKLAPNSPIALRAGDILTILDSRGTRTLRGPGSFSAEGATATQTNTSFTRLISTQSKRRSRTGAVRADGKPVRPDSLWSVDIARDTNFCVSNAAAVQLWRADFQAGETLTLRDETSGKSATVSFAKGFQETAWPNAALPLRDGGRYTLSGGGKTSRVRVTMLDGLPGDPANAGATLFAKGCQPQYDLLVGRLMADGGTGG